MSRRRFTIERSANGRRSTIAVAFTAALSCAPGAEYSHSLGCSVTGGYVYRGRTDAHLVGTYLYADFCTRRVWGGRNNGGAWTASQLATAAGNVYSFGEDAAGEVYLSTGTAILRVD